MAKVYIDNKGVEVLIDMQYDMTSASNVTLEVTRPSGKQFTWRPTIYNTTFFRYITKEDDLDESGTYKIQPHFTLGNWTGYGETVSMTIYAKGA